MGIRRGQRCIAKTVPRCISFSFRVHPRHLEPVLAGTGRAPGRCNGRSPRQRDDPERASRSHPQQWSRHHAKHPSLVSRRSDSDHHSDRPLRPLTSLLAATKHPSPPALPQGRRFSYTRQAIRTAASGDPLPSWSRNWDCHSGAPSPRPCSSASQRAEAGHRATHARGIESRHTTKGRASSRPSLQERVTEAAFTKKPGSPGAGL